MSTIQAGRFFVFSFITSFEFSISYREVVLCRFGLIDVGLSPFELFTSRHPILGRMKRNGPNTMYQWFIAPKLKSVSVNKNKSFSLDPTDF